MRSSMVSSLSSPLTLPRVSSPHTPKISIFSPTVKALFPVVDVGFVSFVFLPEIGLRGCLISNSHPSTGGC